MKIFILGMLFILTSCAHSQMGSSGGFFASQQAADASANAASQAAQAAQPMYFAPMP